MKSEGLTMSEWAAVITGASALAVSLFSLWKVKLAPFKLKATYSSPTFSLYRMEPQVSGGEKSWWIPSIDLTFTFSNIGRRLGEVTDIRLVGSLSEKEFVFYAKWVVDFQKFQQRRGDRFGLTESVLRDWYPLILSSHSQKSLHIIFEGWRWDSAYTGPLKLGLQVYSSDMDSWVEYEQYSIDLKKHMYKATSTFTLWNKRLEKTREGIEHQWDNTAAA